MTPLRETAQGGKQSMRQIEYAYIGSLLADPELIGMYPVKPDHFENKQCSQVYRQQMDGNTDPALILRELGSSFDAVLAEMITHAHAAGVAKHADAIIKAYERRRLTYSATVFLQKLRKGEDVDAAKDEMIRSMDEGQDSELKQVADGAYQAYDDIKKRHEGGSDARRFSSGYPTQDAYTGGMARGELVILAGRSSMGKTAHGCGIVMNVATKHVVYLSSLEMDHTSVAYRLISAISGMDLKLLRTSSNFSQTAWKKAADAVDRISGLKLWIDDNPNRTASQIAARARRLHARHGLDLLMVDYIGLLNSDGNKSLPRHLQIAEMTRTFKAVAKQLDCCVVILCQLNRDAEGQRPTLAHLRESGALEQDADQVLFPYRFNENGVDKAVVIVAKNRNGPTGDAPMIWNASSASFADPGAHYE